MDHEINNVQEGNSHKKYRCNFQDKVFLARNLYSLLKSCSYVYVLMILAID